MIMKHTVFLLLLACITSSCLIRFRYKNNPTGWSELSDLSGLGSDTVFVKNYFLCKRYTDGFFDLAGKQAEIDEDSAMSFFRAAMEKQPIHIVFEAEGKSYCESSLASNRRLNQEGIDLAVIREWGQVQDDGKLRMVPIILIEFLFRNHVFGTPAGFDGGGMIRDIGLKIQPFVFKGEELIFTKGMVYISDTELLQYLDDEAPVTTLEQKHWDELVRLIMKPYVKRLSLQ